MKIIRETFSLIKEEKELKKNILQVFKLSGQRNITG